MAASPEYQDLSFTSTVLEIAAMSSLEIYAVVRKRLRASLALVESETSPTSIADSELSWAGLVPISQIRKGKPGVGSYSIVLVKEAIKLSLPLWPEALRIARAYQQANKDFVGGKCKLSIISRNLYFNVL
ncbi:hypothetical protein KIN20_018728 [Parelaphostrongylus tenuis]|uniref:Uncharacterized protein n=1 Tax=Parelaphostrongylus tenuis TaxID=148309 RepID=A0AAD5QUL5_PARTN|nr:hypothetical protein KIN20_014361 [Parelaphostrongylus tenuis]KAJ1359906.1 hypothetical protein KIN20_018728 [Parelaphostrongylus tenuis]